MSYFVYYDDDYPECGGMGMEMFDSEEEAIVFIEKRLSDRDTSMERSIDCYTLIYGKRKEIEAVETVVRVVVE